MKPDLDLMFTCGVNHMFFHGTTYSPVDDAWPGWKFYASVDMSPTNSIWRDAPALMDYITRSQSMLQQGRPDNDFPGIPTNPRPLASAKSPRRAGIVAHIQHP